jgi:GNAT superfamily N-acetyltransferase
MAQEWQRGEFVISTDDHRLDVSFIHSFLKNSSYWGQGRSLELVARSVEHSLNFGLFKGTTQIGFARIVTDYATFAWVCDVFILDEHRGQGLSKWLLEVMTTHSRLQGLRRWALMTRDAHELYRRFGFSELRLPDRWLERLEGEAQNKTP